MSIFGKNSIACIVMALMIAAGTLIGGRNTLMGMRGQAEAVFTLGVRGDGIGIAGDLREREAAASNMVVIARKYLPEENALIRNTTAARDALLAASDVRQKAEADKALEAAVRDLYNVLEGMDLSEQDARFPQRLYVDFRSGGERISHDPYNGKAADFNRVLSGFPASILGALTGVGPLALFE